MALGLLGYDLAGDRAGLVPGTALAVQMVAYVLLSPVMIWQVLVHVGPLQAASAAVTTTFQPALPDVVNEYRRASSASRLTVSLEDILSPLPAAVLLTVVTVHTPYLRAVLAVLGLTATVSASRSWPRGLPQVVRHAHGRPAGDHVRHADRDGSRWVHTHRIVNEAEHTRWPSHAQLTHR